MQDLTIFSVSICFGETMTTTKVANVVSISGTNIAYQPLVSRSSLLPFPATTTFKRHGARARAEAVASEGRVRRGGG